MVVTDSLNISHGDFSIESSVKILPFMYETKFHTYLHEVTGQVIDFALYLAFYILSFL